MKIYFEQNIVEYIEQLNEVHRISSVDVSPNDFLDVENVFYSRKRNGELSEEDWVYTEYEQGVEIATAYIMNNIRYNLDRDMDEDFE